MGIPTFPTLPTPMTHNSNVIPSLARIISIFSFRCPRLIRFEISSICESVRNGSWWQITRRFTAARLAVSTAYSIGECPHPFLNISPGLGEDRSLVGMEPSFHQIQGVVSRILVRMRCNHPDKIW